MFISLLEMSKVYDLVGQPSYIQTGYMIAKCISLLHTQTDKRPLNKSAVRSKQQ